ncbi:MAG: elongation factor G [Elusimicrobia bacterium]|nr:elongation factor G [Elusimicrobiota bacterium]
MSVNKVVAITGEPNSGKTQLCEAIAHKTGVTTRLNLVDKGQSIFDSQPDEKERGISIDLSVGFFEKEECRINLIDTPGYADFIGEVIAGVWASDIVLIVVDAASPITFASKKIFGIAAKYEKPVAFYINGIKKPSADYDARLDEIKKKITINVAPIFVMASSEIINVFDTDSETPYRESLIETIASSDDSLLEKYLSQGSLSPGELKGALKNGIKTSKIVPVLCGDAVEELGIENLIDFLAEFIPGTSASPSGKGVAQVFKISSQGHIGEIALAKVVEGTIKQGSDIHNLNKGTSGRVTQIVKLFGMTRHQVQQASAGDIVGFVKLKDVSAGDTISEDKSKQPLKFAEFPQPVYSVAVKPKNKGEEEKVATSLASIRRENPIVNFGFNAETKEMVLAGMGNIQLDVFAKRIISNFNAEIVLSPPRIPYKETITAKTEAEGKYKKQTGGHGQYGHCFIRFEPLERGKGFEFVNQIVGGAIPSNYIPAIEKGLINSMEKGVIAGYPVVDVRATLYDGSFHEVDSSNLAFEIAASFALKKAVTSAKPIVLEPIMELEISFPEEFMGSISGDITSRRGRIVTFDKDGDTQIIKALVPQAEILEYVNDLRSMTKGQGDFTCRFSHYEPAPANIMNALVEKYNKEMAEGR